MTQRPSAALARPVYGTAGVGPFYKTACLACTSTAPKFDALYSLRENSILYEEATLRAAEKLCFVSGHDFSRAIKIEKKSGFSPCLSYPVPNFSAAG
jgi:hypothetical protein